MKMRERKEGLPEEGKAKQREWEEERAKAPGRGVSRANVMQECQLQMEWGIYSLAIMAPAWVVNGLGCIIRGVVVMRVVGGI